MNNKDLNQNQPARKIPKNYRNITGKISSKKANGLISYESKLERDFAYIFDFSDEVDIILEQPVTIKYLFDGEERRYTPDFCLWRRGKKNLLIEVKYHNELKKNFEELKYKFRAAMLYAQKNDFEFRILTDRCPYIRNKDYLFNVHFLRNYDYINYEKYKLIKSKYTPDSTIQDLLNSISNNKYEQLNYINSVWTLVRKHIIVVNLETKLTAATKILDFKKYSQKDFANYIGPTGGIYQ